MTTHVRASSKSPVTHRPLTVRCYLYSEGHGFFAAECIDLNILVKGKSADIAKRKLKQAISGYIDSAAEMGETESLIPRRSPWGRIVRYYFLGAVHHIAHSGFFTFFKYSPD